MKREGLLPFLLALQEECGGVIPVERFMKEALYHPVYGYYAGNIRDVGTRGDFSTSATLDPTLASAIAAWITRRSRESGWKTIPVIECGAGSGELARRVIRALPWRVRLRLRYMIHETSPSLLQVQKRTLRLHGVTWVSSMAEALRHSSERALIFSNELVDAFPCRVFRRGESAWKELGLRIDASGGQLELKETEFGDPLPATWFSHFAEQVMGQRVERHDSYVSWTGEWAECWREGAMLTIDYGDLAPGLVMRAPHGTLRAYWKHQRITGLGTYARFGMQDLTADVNFSDLIRAGEKRGWTTLGFESQSEFVTRHTGLTSSLGEAADAFKVLEQSPE